MEEQIYRDINELLDVLPDIIKDFRRNNTNPAYKKMQNIMPQINRIYISLLEHKAEYEKLGVELPQDIIMAQLNNMADGFEYRDSIKLGDTLEYEIINTLSLYKELIEEKGMQ